MPSPAPSDLVGDPDRVVTDADANRTLDALGDVDEAALHRRVSGAAAAPSGPRRDALRATIGVLDLTSLRATDHAERIRRLCDAARRPDPDDPSTPSVAAVCVTPDLVGVARQALADDPLPGGGVRAACVAGGFPSSRTFGPVKLAEATAALDAGAQELDVVLDRAAFLAGRYAEVLTELRGYRIACDRAVTGDGPTGLKVILEVAELGDATTVRRAAWLALIAGADFVKTSTGTVTPGATPEAVLLLLETVAEFSQATGERRGVKAAGGIRDTDTALGILALAESVGGDDALTSARLRIGASGLLDNLVAELRGTS